MPVFHPSVQDPISQSLHDAWVCITDLGKLPFNCHVLSTLHGASNMLCTQHTSEGCPASHSTLHHLSQLLLEDIQSCIPAYMSKAPCCNWLTRRWALHLGCRCLCFLSLGLRNCHCSWDALRCFQSGTTFLVSLCTAATQDVLTALAC